MVKCLKVKIFGRVQGVLFRASAKNEATTLGLVGFVRNEADGSVYLEVQGEEVDLIKFLEWCKKGPRMANIVRVETEEIPIKHFTDFQVL